MFMYEYFLEKNQNLKHMKPLRLLALFIIPMGLIIAAVPQNKTKPYKLTADQLLDEANTRTPVHCS